MNKDKELKQKFVEMFKFVVPSGKGFICLFEDIEYDTKNLSISNDPSYPFLKEKMIKTLKLVNSDLSLIEKDIETEIWNLV